MMLLKMNDMFIIYNINCCFAIMIIINSIN